MVFPPKKDLKKKFLPSSGPEFLFAARKILDLSEFLDFVDSSGRKSASVLVEYIFSGAESTKTVQESTTANPNQIELVLNLAGDQKFKKSAGNFALRVFPTPEEFVENISKILGDLLGKLREEKGGNEGENVLTFLKCLVGVDLLLSNVFSLRKILGSSIQPEEILHSLLLPGV